MSSVETSRSVKGAPVIADVAVIAAFPFVLTWLNNTWIFVRPYSIDRWLYSGLHLHLPEMLRYYWWTYYASRAPWNIVGWAIHRVLPVEPALYVLHFGVFYLGVLSLYFAVLRLFSNRAVALMCAMFLATQSEFLTAAGWDYVDGFYAACLLLGFAAMVSVVERTRWRAAAALWGCASALVISTFAPWVVLVAIQALMFIVLNARVGRRPIWNVVGYFLSGAIGTVVLIGLANRLLGGPFLYFIPQITAVVPVAVNRPKIYAPLQDYIWTAPYLIVPAAAAAYALFYIVRSIIANEHRDVDPRVHVVMLGALVAFCIFVVVQEAFHFEILQFSEYVNALLPFSFMAIAGALAVGAKQLLPRTENMLAWCTGIAVFIPWTLSTLSIVPGPSSGFGGMFFECVWTSMLIAALVIVRWLPSAGYLLSIACLTVLGYGVTGNHLYVQLMSFPPNPLYREETLAIFKASDQIGRYDTDLRARFWLNAKDSAYEMERAVNSTFLAAYSKVNEDFPSLIDADGTSSQIEPGDRIVILTSMGRAVERAERTLSALHVKLTPIADQRVGSSSVHFNFVIADASLIEPRLAAARPVAAPTNITTPTVPWAYGAVLPVPRYSGPGDSGHAIVAVSSKTSSDNIWLGLLTRDEKAFVVRRRLPSTSEFRQTAFVDVDLNDVSGIVVENGPNRGSGRLNVASIKVLIPRRPH